jgi:two-component system chemotaxis sensor kinase CheA
VQDEFSSLLTEFVGEALERTTRIEQVVLETPSLDGPAIDTLRRELHTIKGNAGMMGLSDLRTLVHGIEDALTPQTPAQELLSGVDLIRAEVVRLTTARPDLSTPREGPSNAPVVSVRLTFDVIDELMNLAGESLTARNRLGSIVSSLTEAAGDDALADAHRALQKCAGDLERAVSRLRMVPLAGIFSSLRRIVQDECTVLGKRAAIHVSGSDTAIDRALLDAVGEALTHIVRNAIVHGIETPEIREQRGKSPEGRIEVVARGDSSHIHIQVQDDGGGIDPERLSAVARERGMDSGAVSDPLRLLFLPGFSTHDDTNESAGRGMGLAAVLDAVRRSAGDIDVRSVRGKGSRFVLRLPLEVSVVRTLLIEVGGETFGLPLQNVLETIRLNADATHIIGGNLVMRHRGRTLPLLHLSRDFGWTGRNDGLFVVIVEVERAQRGILVEGLNGIVRLVVKPLEKMYSEAPTIAGTTILPDGRAVLMLDVHAIVGGTA